MRTLAILLASAAVASPALAQQPQAGPPTDDTAIPAELADPRHADRLVDALKVLSGAFLQLPVGEVEAALEGRQPTAADRQRTVRSESGLTDQELTAQIEQSRPMMRAGQQALVKALPAMMRGMAEARRELESAATNLPRPGYPKR